MSKKLFYYGSTASFSNLYSNNLDGVNEWVNFGAASELVYQYANNFSFSIWMKADVNGLLSGLITYNGDILSASGGWMVLHQSNKIRFYVDNAGVSLFIESNTTITTGQWYHICCTVSSGKLMKLYINATLQTATASYGSINYTADNCRLRLGVYAGIRYFDGRLAYPKIFNKELSAAEVAEDYALLMGNYTSLSFAANVVFAGAYPNGQSDYPTLTDLVGGINGTMTNQESTDINTDIPT